MLSAPAGATVMLKVELPELVGRADVIFVGKVTKLESHWTEDRKHIVTDATFQVVQNVRGVDSTKTVVIRSMGGVVNGVGMRVFGSPQFSLGQEALLFADQRQGHHYVTGMTQGVFTVSRDHLRRATVHSSSAGVTLTRRSKAGGLETINEAPPVPEALESFVSRIHETIALCTKDKTRCQGR